MPAIDYDKALENKKARLFKDKAVTDKNKECVKEFLGLYHKRAARIGIVLSTIHVFLKQSKDIKKEMFDKKKLNSILGKIKEDKPGYFETLRNNLPVFCKLLNDDKPVEELIETFKKFPKIKNARDLTRKDMLTWEDGLKMEKKAHSIQVKAIIMTQLDAGLRPSEFVDLKYGDVERKNDFLVLHVKGKTGERDVLCWRCVPYLSRWLTAHPTKKDEDPLWLQEQYTNGKVIQYKYAAMLRRINQVSIDVWGFTTKMYQRTERGKKIEKKIPKRHLDFYLLRHSSCFIDKLDNLPLDVAAERHGHSIDFFKDVYGRLDVNDTMNRIRTHYGDEEEETVEGLKNITCSKCEEVNPPETEICQKCGSALTIKKAVELERAKSSELDEIKKKIENIEKERGKSDSVMEKLMKDPEIQKVFMKKMVELGIKA